MTMELRSDLVVPHCPHCGSDAMGEAPITLEQLIDAWPLPGFVPVGSDGFLPAARADQHLVLDCPVCRKPSALSIDSSFIKLVAARTDTDARLLGGGAVRIPTIPPDRQPSVLRRGPFVCRADLAADDAHVMNEAGAVLAVIGQEERQGVGFLLSAYAAGELSCDSAVAALRELFRFAIEIRASARPSGPRPAEGR